MRESLLVFVALLAGASLVLAGEQVSVERGKQLFASKQLGTNGKSCAGCHPDGEGLAEAADLSDQELAKVVNTCIEKPLKGKPLDPASAEMKSLIAYIRSLR